ncbi:MAG: hypothetical protein LBJ25_00370 [Candidatus Margulisbacteria bacterium]|jgi:hypothetical protein|nr:hypothetical protein [Candidatus Margulisiibacteriota bacterium]
MRVKTAVKTSAGSAKIWETAVWIFMGVFLALWFYVNYSTIYGLDFTSNLLQAKDLAAGGRLFQNSRAGFNLTNLLIYAPLFKLSGNFALVRAVGRLLTQILLLLSCVFFTKQLGVKKPWRLLTACFLLLPVGADNYIFLMNNGLIYALMLALFGFFLRLPLSQNRAAQNIFFITLAFLSGVCSFQLYFLYSPQEMLARAGGFLLKLWQFLGFYPDVKVFSLRGIFSLASIIFGLSLFKLWRNNKEQPDARAAILPDFLAKAFLFTLAVAVLTYQPCGGGQYAYFALFIFIAPFIAWHFDQHGLQKPLSVFLLIYLLAGGLYAFGSYYKFARENTKVHAPLAAFLTAGEYRFGYYASCCRRGEALQELTDGRTRLAPLNLTHFDANSNWEPQWGTFVLVCNYCVDKHRTHPYLQNSPQLYSDADYTLFTLQK